MGFCLLLGDNSLDKTIEGTPAKIPNPNKYNIGRNCVAVSPAKLKVAENSRYKYLIIIQTNLIYIEQLIMCLFFQNQIKQLLS